MKVTAANVKKGRIPTGPTIVANKVPSESLRIYEQDIEILSRRIADLNGVAQPEHTASTFVNGLRTSVEGSRGGEDDNALKVHTIEAMLERVVELDRLVLKRTEIKARSRRGSRGADLFTIPTHLLVLDRLLDVYAISQRPTIVQSQSSIVSEDPSPPDDEELKLRTAEVTRLSKALADSDSAKAKLQDTLNKKTAEMEALKAQYKTHLQQVKDANGGTRSPRSPRPSPNLAVIGSGSSVPAPDSNIARLEAENAELRSRLAASEQMRRSLEEKCEIAAASHQSSLASITALTDRFSQKDSNLEIVSLADGASVGVPPDTKRALESLITSIAQFMKQQETAAPESSPPQDTTTLSEENQSLKDEITSLRMEYSQKIQLLQRAGEKAEVDHAESAMKDMKTIADLERKILEHDMSTRELKIELSGLRAQLVKGERYPEKIAQLQSQLLDMDDRRAALEGRVQECLAEIEALTKINDNLKTKLKDMSGTDDRRDFADTFEEVMREEMMAMKVAFEAKLRIAKAETEAASRRNQLEIMKMQSPHTLGSC